LQTEAELQRERLLIEAHSKERHALALQNRDELSQAEKQREREIAKIEAEKKSNICSN